MWKGLGWFTGWVLSPQITAWGWLKAGPFSALHLTLHLPLALTLAMRRGSGEVNALRTTTRACPCSDRNWKENEICHRGCCWGKAKKRETSLDPWRQMKIKNKEQEKRWMAWGCAAKGRIVKVTGRVWWVYHLRERKSEHNPCRRTQTSLEI